MIAFALVEGWRNFINISIFGLLTVASLSLTLILLGTAAYGYKVLETWQTGVRSRFEIEAFLRTDIETEQVEDIAGSIKKISHVKDVRIVTQEEAAQRFEKQFGQDLMNLLGFNPLPMSLLISLDEGADPSTTWAGVAQNLRKFADIDDVVYEGEILMTVDRFYKKSGIIVLAGTVILLVISLLLTIMTVVGTIKTREQFIRVIAMSGGSRAMARMPFIVAGGYYGLTSGVIALAAIFVIRWITGIVTGISEPFPVLWYTGILLTGILISVVGAGATAGRLIKHL